MSEDEQYYAITRENLLREIKGGSQFDLDPDLLNTLKPRSVLDIGCGIGQALFALAVRCEAFGVGVDISQYSLTLGREFYRQHMPGADIAFTRAAAESLPFAESSFDLVNCGLALPYMHNAAAFAEVSRVLRPGGVFLLKIHHTYYYLSEIWRGITGAGMIPVVHGTRVLAAGTVYHLTGRQPRVRFLNESFQTRWLLGRELAKHGLFIEKEQANTSSLAPAFVIRKGP